MAWPSPVSAEFLGLLLLSLFAGVGLGLAERTRQRCPVVPPWVDAVVTLALAAGGGAYAHLLHRTGNPQWIPVGQDWMEFLHASLAHVAGYRGPPVPNRYPLYPYLGALVARMQGHSVATGAMQVSIAAAGLLPAALFVLGRLMAPRPIAIAGAVAAMHVPTLLLMMGPPTEYIFHAFLQTLVLGVGAWAIRYGGWARFFCFGIVLALLMGSAAKALPVVLLSIPLAFAALLWHERHRWPRALLAAFLFVLPLVAMWASYHSVYPGLHTLEGLVLRAQRDRALHAHRQFHIPTDYGWPPQHDLERLGYWRVGDPKALTHLPDTLRFLARGAEGNFTFQERFRSIVRGVQEELRIPPQLFLLLLPACLAAGVRRRRTESRGEHLFAHALTSCYVTASMGLHILSIMSSTYEARYALSVLVLLPLFLLAGAVAVIRIPIRGEWRHEGYVFWPPAIALVAWLAYGPGPFGYNEIRHRLEQQSIVAVGDLYQPLWNLRRQSSGLQLVDLTGYAFLPAIFSDVPVARPMLEEGVKTLVLPGSSWNRRVIVQPCQFAQGNPVDRYAGPAGRLKSLSLCLDEDTLPHQALSLERTPPQGQGNSH